MLRKNAWWMAVLGGSALSLFILFWFNPTQSGFYPRCTFHSLTGLDCPGCGGLRAMHQVLHGNFGTAFSLNPLLITLLPILLFFLLNHCVERLWRRPLLKIKIPLAVVWILLVVVIAFTILRNLSLPAFSWMSASP